MADPIKTTSTVVLAVAEDQTAPVGVVVEAVDTLGVPVDPVRIPAVEVVVRTTLERIKSTSQELILDQDMYMSNWSASSKSPAFDFNFHF